MRMRELGHDTILTTDEVVFVKSYNARAFYECPWCGKDADHLAVVSLEDPGMDMRPIHCFETMRMAWLDVRDGDRIKATLHGEEVKYRRLLNRFEGLDGPLTPEEAFRLRTSQGCPEELLEDLVTDLTAFRSLLDAHRATSRRREWGGAYGCSL